MKTKDKRATCLGSLVRAAVVGAALIVAFADVSFAQQAAEVFSPAPVASGAEQPTFMGSLVQMLPMLAICYFIFYFMVMKPQDTRSKKHKGLIESLKRGDSVVTSSGIVGKIAGVEKEYVLLEIARDVKVKVQQQHIVAREEEKAAAAA
jgi:preprotein translocase subunit YajC